MRAALALGVMSRSSGDPHDHPAASADPVCCPRLASLIVIAVKDSAIASVIAVPELLRQSQVLAGKTYRPFEIYTAAMLIYFLICYPTARLIDRVYRQLAPLRGVVRRADDSLTGPVLWENRNRLLEGAGVTIVLTTLDNGDRATRGLLLALLRLSPVAVVPRRYHRVR